MQGGTLLDNYFAFAHCFNFALCLYTRLNAALLVLHCTLAQMRYTCTHADVTQFDIHIALVLTHGVTLITWWFLALVHTKMLPYLYFILRLRTCAVALAHIQDVTLHSCRACTKTWRYTSWNSRGTRARDWMLLYLCLMLRLHTCIAIAHKQMLRTFILPLFKHMMLHLCCRIVLVLGYFILRKWRNNAKKMDLENANLKEEHMTMQKNWKTKCKLKRDKHCKWRKHVKSKCNLERGTFDRWKTHGKNHCKLEGGDMICGE